MNTQRYTVNVRVGGIGSPRVAVSQGDIGRRLVFNLFDGAVAFAMTSGTTATIVGRKPSGLGFAETCTHDGGNSVSVRTTEAMTQEAGKIPAELRISDGTKVIGTANFVFYVEPSPHPDGTTDGTLETIEDLQTQIGDLSNLTTSEKSSLVGAINEAAQSGGSEITVDNTLTTAGAAADAKKTGDEIASLKADLGDLDERVEALEEGGSGVPASVKSALASLFHAIPYDDDMTSEIAIIDSWAAEISGVSVNPTTASINGSSTTQLVATTTPAGGTVTWESSNTAVATVSSSGLVTGIGNGQATITARCGNYHATCAVTVSGFRTLTSISAVYSGGTVYDTATLNDLKSSLVVTANYDDSTTQTVTDYTLSGTLAVGTSTITVSYGGKTTTFSVTVEEAPAEETLWISGYDDGNATNAQGKYAPFYYPDTLYTYDRTKEIVAIELNVTTAGVLSIGHQDQSTLTVGSTTKANARASNVVDEVLTIANTGKQKIYLENPITLQTGEILSIGASTDTAVFAYGAEGTDKQFWYCGTTLTLDANRSLGINVYTV